MKKLLGALTLAFALLFAGCGDSEPGPDYPSPEPGKLPGQEVGSGGMDLDALAAESDLEEEPAEAPAEDAEGAEAEDAEAEAGDEGTD